MGDKGDKSAARPPEGCPAEAGGLFGPESALGFEHPSGTNARRPSQKAGSLPQKHIYLIYMSKPHFPLNNQQFLISHKTKPNIFTVFIYIISLSLYISIYLYIYIYIYIYIYPSIYLYVSLVSSKRNKMLWSKKENQEEHMLEDKAYSLLE